MSGILKPPIIPATAPSRTAEWMGFFMSLISRTPQLNEVHLVSAGIIYFGDAATNGSWRIRRSADDFVHERREAGSWVEKHKIED